MGMQVQALSTHTLGKTARSRIAPARRRKRPPERREREHRPHRAPRSRRERHGGFLRRSQSRVATRPSGPPRSLRPARRLPPHPARRAGIPAPTPRSPEQVRRRVLARVRIPRLTSAVRLGFGPFRVSSPRRCAASPRLEARKNDSKPAVASSFRRETPTLGWNEKRHHKKTPPMGGVFFV